MADFPNYLVNSPQQIISPLSAAHSCSGILSSTGLSPTSAVWSTGNTALYFPVIVEKTVTATQMWTYNGTVVSGNVDVGIYDITGARLVSMGSTAQAGTSTIQLYNIADTTLTPAVYLLALNCDNTTATFFKAAVSAVGLRSCGAQQQAVGAIALPATATFASMATAYLPMFGVLFQSTM